MSSTPSQHPQTTYRASDDDGFPVSAQENQELLAFVGAAFLALIFGAAVILRGGF